MAEGSGKVKKEGREDAIRYEALTRLDLKGWADGYTVSFRTRFARDRGFLGIGIASDPVADHLHQNPLPARISR